MVCIKRDLTSSSKMSTILLPCFFFFPPPLVCFSPCFFATKIPVRLVSNPLCFSGMKGLSSPISPPPPPKKEKEEEKSHGGVEMAWFCEVLEGQVLDFIHIYFSSYESIRSISSSLYLYISHHPPLPRTIFHISMDVSL